MHDRQNVCLQLVVTWASNSKLLQTGQCSVLSLGPRAVPKPRGQVASGVSAALSFEAKGHMAMSFVSGRAAVPPKGHPVPVMLALLLLLTVLAVVTR
jgi:hypothetical protein